MEHTKESVRALINRNALAVERGILALYARQTADEKQTDTTRHDNNVGFNHADAPRGSYYGRWLSSGRHFNDKHLAKARAMLQKYCGQLANIANEKAREASHTVG